MPLMLVLALLPLASLAAAPKTDAMLILKDLVKTGNRYAGAPKRDEAVERLSRYIRESGLEVETTPFTSADPRDGRPWSMVNVVGRLRPEASCRFLLGTHFDTRHEAERDPDPAKRAFPIPGANDGTSGVAVLLALAPRLAKLVPPHVGVDVALFDGEEMGYPGYGGYCAGSQQYGRALKGAPSKPRFGIILDMVCAPEGVFKVEPFSRQAHPALVDALWGIGARRAPQAFSRERSIAIDDDHLRLTQAGVPSVLVIGFDYSAWHTLGDRLERCSAKRLTQVQAVLEEFIKTKLQTLLECP